MTTQITQFSILPKNGKIVPGLFNSMQEAVREVKRLGFGISDVEYRSVVENVKIKKTKVKTDKMYKFFNINDNIDFGDINLPIELLKSLNRIADTHINNWRNKKIKENLLDGFDISDVTCDLEKESVVGGALMRSMDSSLGSLYEKLIEQISIYYNELTIRKLKTINNSTNAKKKSGYKVDLLFHRNGNVFIIELKLHCELDNKKAKAEKQSLQILKQVYTSEISISGDNVHTFLGVIGNKDGKNPSDFKMGRLHEAFDRSELLVAEELFNFVSGNDTFYNEWKKFKTNHISKKLNEAIATIKKQYI
jgi:hypothetical protein